MLTLSQFADAVSQEEGLYYDQSLYTKWQQGKRTPKDRSLILKLIHLFTTHGGITTLEQANSLLTSVGLMRLSEEEREQIEKGNLYKAEDTTHSKKTPSSQVNFNDIFKQVFSNNFYRFVILSFIILSAWFLHIYINAATESEEALYWVLFTGVIPLSGVRYFLRLPRKQTNTTKAVFFFCAGMVSQGVGLLVWNTYNRVGVAIPYPSWADVGYAGTIFWYLLGALYLTHNRWITRGEAYLKSKETLLLLAPIMVLLGGLSFYLANINISIIEQITILLNIMYPVGHVLSVLLLIYGYIKNKHHLIRAERLVFLLILLAVSMQFITDYSFVIAFQLEAFENGGILDYIFTIDYLVMNLALGMVIGAQQNGLFAYSPKNETAPLRASSYVQQLRHAVYQLLN